MELRSTPPSGAPYPGALRRPIVAGVGGGVGTTTVARALGGVDAGVFTGRRVDVLVCRATGDSLVRAGRAAQLVAGGAGRPAVAITSADARGPSRPVGARLRLLEPHARAVVLLPFVRRWRDLAVPLDDVTGLLSRPPQELPRPLRRYAMAVRALHAALGTAPPRPTRLASPSRPRRTSPTPERTR